MRQINLNAVLACALSGCLFASANQTAPTSSEADRDRAKQEVIEVVKRGREIPEQDYTYQSWNQMRFALDRANRAANQSDTTAAQLGDALIELKTTIDALKRREVAPDTNPRLGLSTSLFATSESGPVNNVSLRWSARDACDRYTIERATAETGPFEAIYTGTGRSCDDVALADGTYFYRLVAHRGDAQQTSAVARIATTPMPAGLATFSNETNTEPGLPHEPLKIGDTYYQFKTIYGESRRLERVIQLTSTDGKTWQDGPVVMDQKSHPDLADCKFEAGTIFYDKAHDQVVWWCHWELSGPRYGHGRAMVASAKPGQPFTVHHIFNPLGVQVRDMSIYVDDDKQAYLVAASNVPGQGANATLYIFRLNSTYDDVVEITAKVIENGYREAPHIVKKDGFYYFFYSQAAGWYPSRGGYVSAKSISGPWSEPRSIGNPSTFASQSGPVIQFGTGENKVPVMMGNRWIRGDGTSRFSALPIQMAQGFAFYDYAPTLLNNPATGLIIPLQMGRLLSQDRPSEASITPKAGSEAAKAFDGDYDTSFTSDQKQWPFSLTTDLGSVSTVRNVQVSWFLHKGSEAFYTYTIDGSADGKEWKTLLDRSDAANNEVSKTFGFTSDILPEGSTARYVRLNVLNAHLHNNPNNWYPPTVYEVKVFGDPKP